MANELSEFLVQSHEALAGELMGRLLDTDAKLRMSNERIKGLIEKVMELKQVKEQLNQANQEIELLKEALNDANRHNHDLQTRNSELSFDRQTKLEASAEELEQEDVKHNQAEAE